MKQYFTKVSINIPDTYLLKILRWTITLQQNKQKQTNKETKPPPNQQTTNKKNK